MCQVDSKVTPLQLDIYPFFLRFFFSIEKNCFSFVFLGPHPQHMKVPRLGVQSELQLLAYTTATAMQDPSLICDLHYSSRQPRIFYPLSGARDRTCNLMVPHRILFCCTTTGTPGPTSEFTSPCPMFPLCVPSICF